MASFQRAAVWRVEPELEPAIAMPVNDAAARLHLPLALVIGAKDSPDQLRFLVSVLGAATSASWRIAAPFTTSEKVIAGN